MHEFVFSGKCLTEYGVHTLDLAKGMIDRGIHPPTVYFPLNVPQAFMVEPTESEDRDTLDHFVQVVEELFKLAKNDPDQLHKAPVSTPVGRLDEVKAARDMRLSYS